MQAQIATLAADRQQLQTQLDQTVAEPKQKAPPAIEQPAIEQPAIDLSDKAGKVASFFKTLLATDTKLIKLLKQDKDIRLPKDTISKIEEILGGGDG
ncbi:hypothetical protein [Microcoleus sp. AT9b-C5]|uniref:hypothetical protein n=1 Tax=unclassified Microcoleus TaxID=2642155 RepID=UPI002FD5D9CA